MRGGWHKFLLEKVLITCSVVAIFEQPSLEINFWNAAIYDDKVDKINKFLSLNPLSLRQST